MTDDRPATPAGLRDFGAGVRADLRAALRRLKARILILLVRQTALTVTLVKLFGEA